ncbi:hypothetical protein DFP74_2957 [Nocardiopsis sp. Huas11]|uniref:hypothetical protein n=1 Tax=Nocardiopsis sp. Huas11 TaxID=2183912 RepID=UPI000EADA46D|nr:hypothetical protein [Nocardiopsis sp. Huas11]RKS07293.1 hypothetical protein DFP74_2957 [Nocardiopsis sp. Huas11]
MSSPDTPHLGSSGPSGPVVLAEPVPAGQVVDAPRPAPRGRTRIGGLTIGTALLTGALLVAFSATAPSRTPEFIAQTDSTGTMTFEVHEGEEGVWALYGNTDDAMLCHHITPSGATPRPETGTKWRTDDGRWILLGVLDTSEPGTHTFTCERERHGVFAVGGSDVVAATRDRRIAGLVGGGAVAGAGLLLGLGVIVSAAAARRRAAEAEAAGAGAGAAHEEAGPAPR